MILWCASVFVASLLFTISFFSMKAKKHETQREKDAAIHSGRFHRNECEHPKIELATMVAATEPQSCLTTFISTEPNALLQIENQGCQELHFHLQLYVTIHISCY